jgi:hypothetical protein
MACAGAASLCARGAPLPAEPAGAHAPRGHGRHSVLPLSDEKVPAGQALHRRFCRRIMQGCKSLRGRSLWERCRASFCGGSWRKGTNPAPLVVSARASSTLNSSQRNCGAFSSPCAHVGAVNPQPNRSGNRGNRETAIQASKGALLINRGG